MSTFLIVFINMLLAASGNSLAAEQHRLMRRQRDTAHTLGVQASADKDSGSSASAGNVVPAAQGYVFLTHDVETSSSLTQAALMQGNTADSADDQDALERRKDRMCDQQDEMATMLAECENFAKQQGLELTPFQQLNFCKKDGIKQKDSAAAQGCKCEWKYPRACFARTDKDGNIITVAWNERDTVDSNTPKVNIVDKDLQSVCMKRKFKLFKFPSGGSPVCLEKQGYLTIKNGNLCREASMMEMDKAMRVYGDEDKEMLRVLKNKEKAPLGCSMFNGKLYFSRKPGTAKNNHPVTLACIAREYFKEWKKAKKEAKASALLEVDAHKVGKSQAQETLMRSEAEKPSAKASSKKASAKPVPPHSEAWLLNKDARPCHSYVILTDQDTQTCTELGMEPVLDGKGCREVAKIATEHDTDFAKLEKGRFEDESKPAGCYHLAPKTKDCSHPEGCFKFNRNPGFKKLKRKAERKQSKGKDASDILKELSEMNTTGFVCKLPSWKRQERGEKACPKLNGLEMYQTISDEDACSEYSGCMSLELGSPFRIGDKFNPEGNSVTYNIKDHPTGCLARPHATIQNGDMSNTPKVFWNNPNGTDAGSEPSKAIDGSASAEKVCEVIKVVQFHREHTKK
jgi:hypothetical protein